MALGTGSLTAEWKGLVMLFFLLQRGSDPTRPLLPSLELWLCRESLPEQNPLHSCPPTWGEVPRGLG